MSRAERDDSNLTHARCLETDPLASLTDGQLYRASNDPALGRSLGLAFADKEAAIGPESIATFMAVEAVVVPLAADCSNHYLVHDVLLAAQTARCCAAGVALETPCEAILFNKGCL